MFKFFAVLALVALTTAHRLDLDDLWTTFKAKHFKQYQDAEEETLRRAVWESNLDVIQKHNLEADRGLHTFIMGENEFTDMTNDEFRQMMNGYRMVDRVSQVQFVPTSLVADDEVDWRTKGYVTPVKNQLQCGSCWAFSTTGSLEGQTFKKTGKLVSLSEQQLVDCSARYGNKGCKGGLMDNAFKYIKANGGLDTESSYPYTAKTGRECKFKQADVAATDTGFVDIKRGSEDALKQALSEIGPISVAMDAGHMSFQHYRSGVYKERECSSIKLDHGVLAVGYGSEMGKDYWIIKNSWGTTWGDRGYFKIARNDHNMCGIATQGSYPTV